MTRDEILINNESIFLIKDSLLFTHPIIVQGEPKPFGGLKSIFPELQQLVKVYFLLNYPLNVISYILIGFVGQMTLEDFKSLCNS